MRESGLGFDEPITQRASGYILAACRAPAGKSWLYPQRPDPALRHGPRFRKGRHDNHVRRIVLQRAEGEMGTCERTDRLIQRCGVALICALTALLAGAAPAPRPADGSGFRELLDLDSSSSLYVRTDTTNVYVLRSGENGLLIDLGDGSVVPRLAEIGVRQGVPENRAPDVGGKLDESTHEAAAFGRLFGGGRFLDL